MSQRPGQDPNSAAHALSVEEFDELIENHEDLVILDLRSRTDFTQGHIPGAHHVPAQQVTRAALATYAQRSVVVYAEDDQRSAAATATLRGWGWDKVYALAGGVDAWRAAGFALVTESSAHP
jgi:rhodanese-related sulfurtransferase